MCDICYELHIMLTYDMLLMYDISCTTNQQTSNSHTNLLFTASDAHVDKRTRSSNPMAVQSARPSRRRPQGHSSRLPSGIAITSAGVQTWPFLRRVNAPPPHVLNEYVARTVDCSYKSRKVQPCFDVRVVASFVRLMLQGQARPAAAMALPA
jgi:hypothetical protein